MVRATAQILAGAGHDVDLFTRASFRARAQQLHSSLPMLQHPRIRWHWVPEPANNSRTWHLDMARGFNDAVATAYRSVTPDLVEVQDYAGVGAGVATSRGYGALGSTPVVARLNTSAEQIAALDHRPFTDRASRAVSALERATLRGADALLAPSGQVLAYYREFYSNELLPDGHAVWPGFLRDDGLQPRRRAPRTPHLRLLYLGRLQRVKGADLLIEALRADQSLPMELTLIGGDTATGPDGSSMRQHLLRRARNDPRIRFVGPVGRNVIGTHLAAHDALVVPSRWDAWSNVALEALATRRPLLVTPKASLPTMAGEGRFGLVAAAADSEAIGQLLTRAVDAAEELRALAGSPALTDHLALLTRDERVVGEYERLSAIPVDPDRARAAGSDLDALVSAPK